MREAEGANLEQAKPDETLRQKDPAPDKLWKTPSRDTDGVTPAGRVALSVRREEHIETTRANLSGPITEARDVFRAPFAFNRQSTMELASLLAKYQEASFLTPHTSKGETTHECTRQFEIHKV